jgi:N-acetylated-alpha-linked acidic dipeptidase
MSIFKNTTLWLAAAASIAQACFRELEFSVLEQQPILPRRDDVAFPPVLDNHESILVNSFDNTSIATWSYYYTHGYHVAGSNRTMAQWTADRWNENGFTASLTEYCMLDLIIDVRNILFLTLTDVFLNYPVSHSLSLSLPNGTKYTPALMEDVLAEDETTSYPNRVPTFHGYSFTGDASAEYVYVGRGQQIDFKRLKSLGVPLEGKIALSRYGGPFRGLKVKNAQENGMIGAVLFLDPGDDGNITEAKGYAPYPEGPARNPSSVQRGSVQFLSIYPGDPTTPGYPSKKDSPRASRELVTPHIPSLPISWADAVPLLAALDGYGTPGKEVNRTNWVGALNVTYSTGPAPGATMSMSNVMNDTYSSIWDTIGIINGTSQDEVIIIGNHRDAWIVGGAADPNSGSSIMVELSKAFGALLKTGWKPKRTIVLCSWDAEEYGLVGSVEWVEEYIPWLTEAAVSYLNIDIATAGPIPDISATPDLHDIAINTMKKVIYPFRGKTGTLYDAWYSIFKGEVGVLGSGSDYTSFLHRGISSIDMGAVPGPDDPVYHYHSNYDSYHWMNKFGDPGYVTHKAIGQYLTLLAYHLVNDEIIPYNVNTFTNEMRKYLEALNKTVTTNNAAAEVDISPLEDAIDTFNASAAAFMSTLLSASSSTQPASADLITTLNHKLRSFQRGFTSQGGLPDREFYRHVVFAPGLDTGYAPVTFPGVTEQVESGNLPLAEEWVGRTAKGILRAAEVLIL